MLPTEVVAQALLREGRELDRAGLRELRRALRRHEALVAAARALRHGDLSRDAVDKRLERAGTAPAARAEAVAALERIGAVDDARTAVNRATTLAERGYGDAVIRSDLERRGFALEAADAALASIEDEAARVRRLVAARGTGAKTVRFLAARGFDQETIESVVGETLRNGPGESYDTDASPDILPA